MSHRDSKSGKFVFFEKSGAVGVDLDAYLRTEEGQDKIAVIKRLRIKDQKQKRRAAQRRTG